jgi:hypothetical protein
MSKNLLCLTFFAVVVMAAPVRADTLSGLADVTVVDGAIVSFRYEGIEYVVADEDVALGTTTRWYVDAGVETLWAEGDPTPDATVSGTSTVKAGDVGSNADNFMFAVGGDADNISSIDGIDFQETVFPFLTKTFFHFERGGNDTGTWQAILADGSLGAPVAFSGATAYADTGVNVNGQNAYGVVFTTDVPVMGVRITASGHDTLSISALTIIPDFATRPNPQDGSLHEQTWVTLGWSPGLSAVSHDVYLGDNFDDVNDDDGTGATFRGNHASAMLIAGFAGFPYPDGLVPGTTYYWRIDEVNDADPNSPWKGDIWSFSIPPKTAYNPDPKDGAGFVDLNSILAWTGGYDAKLHTIYLGDNYDDVNNATEGTPLGTASYDPGTLEREKVLYWRVDEFDGIETYKGDIWAFTTPGAVGNPQPANGAPDVPMTAKLSWTAADNASSHEVYFGTDADAVKKATTASPEYIGPRALGAESYDPGALAWDSSYAWRVDEVYPDKTVKGLVWSFTTANFIIVDDFEAYNDIDPPDPASNPIFGSWSDGYQIPTNGALTADELPPYAEQNIVHGGAQSMKYLYDTNFMIPESTLTLVYPKDWTQEGVTKLSLWFRGGSVNAAERMFVALNGTAVVYHDDPAAPRIIRWNQWVIDLTRFADQGVDLTNVSTMTIGFGTKNSPAAGGTGKVYFDDIWLVR